MPKIPVGVVYRRKRRPISVRRTTSQLHNFDRGTRLVVRPDGECCGSYTNSHASLARSVGYKSEDQAYANGALRVHYDPATNAIRIEARKAAPRAIALARQIINKVPADLVHVSFGEGRDFRSYIGKPAQVAAEISRPKALEARHFKGRSLCSTRLSYGDFTY